MIEKLYEIGSRVRVLTLLLAVFYSVASISVNAQTYQFGQHVEPAFEGWRTNPDGTFNMMFGYMNENWEEAPKAAIGENNFFAPGEAHTPPQPFCLCLSSQPSALPFFSKDNTKPPKNQL